MKQNKTLFLKTLSVALVAIGVCVCIFVLTSGFTLKIVYHKSYKLDDYACNILSIILQV